MKKGYRVKRGGCGCRGVDFGFDNKEVDFGFLGVVKWKNKIWYQKSQKRARRDPDRWKGYWSKAKIKKGLAKKVPDLEK